MTEEMVGVCGHCEREVYGESEEREAYIKRLSEQLVRATKWAYKQVLYNDSAMMDFDDYVWMIDTKKYEGHTPAPWEITNDGIVGVTEPENVTLHIFSGCYSESDAQLITDAPLLLAEVKRLREGIKQMADTWLNSSEMDGREKLIKMTNQMKELIK